MESHALDWPQSLRQVLDPNHGSEDTGKHTPLSTDHDSVEHVTVDHVNVHAAPSTYTGNTASVSPTRPRSASPSMSAVASSDQNAIHPREWTHADVVNFVEESLPIGSNSSQQCLGTLIKYNMNGAAFYGIVQDENAHDMLRQDFGIVLPMERIIIITGIQQHADRARTHNESPSSKTQTERSKGEETIFSMR